MQLQLYPTFLKFCKITKSEGANGPAPFGLARRGVREGGREPEGEEEKLPARVPRNQGYIFSRPGDAGAYTTAVAAVVEAVKLRQRLILSELSRMRGKRCSVSSPASCSNATPRAIPASGVPLSSGDSRFGLSCHASQHLQRFSCSSCKTNTEEAKVCKEPSKLSSLGVSRLRDCCCRFVTAANAVADLG